MQSIYFTNNENKNAEIVILKITISEGLGVFFNLFKMDSFWIRK